MPDPPWSLRAVVWIAARKDQQGGATAIEYGLLIALIVSVLVVGVTAFGGAVDALFDVLAGAFADLPP